MAGICVIFGKSMRCYLQKRIHGSVRYLAEVCFFVSKMCVVGRSFALDGCHWPWVRRVWVDDLNKTPKGLWRDGWGREGSMLASSVGLSLFRNVGVWSSGERL